jgi:hypothetical protein
MGGAVVRLLVRERSDQTQPEQVDLVTANPRWVSSPHLEAWAVQSSQEFNVRLERGTSMFREFSKTWKRSRLRGHAQSLKVFSKKRCRAPTIIFCLATSGTSLTAATRMHRTAVQSSSFNVQGQTLCRFICGRISLIQKPLTLPHQGY